jgi:hypothetical protein
VRGWGPGDARVWCCWALGMLSLYRCVELIVLWFLWFHDNLMKEAGCKVTQRLGRAVLSAQGCWQRCCATP